MNDTERATWADFEAAMRAAKMNQSDAAAEFGVSRMAVTKWKRAGKVPVIYLRYLRLHTHNKHLRAALAAFAS